MASPAPPIAERPTPGSLPALTEELLEEIFLRLPNPAALARASTACASFRRIITDRALLRRFRALHPPPLLGFVAYDGFHPAEPPHPSAPLARALTGVADFSYSFVPACSRGSRWFPRDVRDGRILLECEVFDDSDDFTDLAVCDPLSRRYVLLPPIPGDLTAPQGHLVYFESFLAPTGEDEEETSFRVICTAQYSTKVVAFVFSSVTRQWCISASVSWSSLAAVAPAVNGILCCFNYAHGCFYWTLPWRDRLLVLDTINHQSGFRRWHRGQPAILAGRESTLEMLFLGDHFEDGSFVLFHTTKQNNCESSNKWQPENIIPLPCRYDYSTIGAAKGLLFPRGIPKDRNVVHSSAENRYPEYFSLEVKTAELEKVCGMEHYFHRVHSYFGFPPSLTKPSI